MNRILKGTIALMVKNLPRSRRVRRGNAEKAQKFKRKGAKERTRNLRLLTRAIESISIAFLKKSD